MQRCKHCKQIVLWKRILVDGESNFQFIHRRKKHGCKEKIGHNDVEWFYIPQPRVCRKCSMPVISIKGEGFIHATEGKCEYKYLELNQTRVPLRIICVPDGPWSKIKLKKLPISERARTCVSHFHTPSGESKIFKRNGAFVVIGIGEIPRNCNLTLESALNQAKRRIWKHKKREAKRRADIVSRLEECDNCPVDWCKYNSYRGEEYCVAPTLEAQEKVKCPYLS